MANQDEINRWQQVLLREIDGAWTGPPMSPSLRNAILTVPRHLFIERYHLKTEDRWRQVSPSKLEPHLPDIYKDQPLALVHPKDGIILSAQSKPSFIFALLNALEIEKGQRILEIGSGSGWLAAVVANLVGDDGEVFGVEILNEAVMLSQRGLARADINNVQIIEADGCDGYQQGAPYDRVIITACSETFPAWLFDQVKVGGLVMIPLLVPGGGDCMFLMKREANGFRSIFSRYSLSVPMSGRGTIHVPYLMDRSDFARISALRKTHLRWNHLDFSTNAFLERTLECRQYLSITEADFVAYNTDPSGTPLRQDNLGFGIEDHDSGSLALAGASGITVFGNMVSFDRFQTVLGKWSELRKSGDINFELSIRRASDRSTLEPEHSWQRERAGICFFWHIV